ncbi:MAG: trypsin-like serine protease [Bdellovibrionota bacterium]
MKNILLLFFTTIVHMVGALPSFANSVIGNGMSLEEIQQVTGRFVRLANDSTTEYFCSGIVIAPKVVLTASHCIDGIQGEKNIYFDLPNHQDLSISQSAFSIKTVVRNKNFNVRDFNGEFFLNEKSIDHDFSFVVLEKNIPNLPFVSYYPGNLESRIELIYIGALQEGQLSLLDNLAMRRCNSNKGGFYSKNRIIIKSNCGLVPGNSGGPIFLKKKYGSEIKFYLLGTASGIGIKKSTKEILDIAMFSRYYPDRIFELRDYSLRTKIWKYIQNYFDK